MGLAFSQSDAISVQKLLIPQVNTTSDSNKYVEFSHLCKYHLRDIFNYLMPCILKHLNWDIFSLSEHTLRMFVVNAHTGINVIKLFTPVIYNCSHQARVFVTGQPFQPSLIFLTKDGALPSGAPKKDHL